MSCAKPTKAALVACLKHIQTGDVVVMPTDTVYGLVIAASEPGGIQAISELKGRSGKLGTLLFANEQQLLDFGFRGADIANASQFWPGPTSVILPTPLDSHFYAGGYDSLAVRIPNLSWLQELLIDTGPLLTTSANLNDQPVVTSITEARAVFGSRVPYYMDFTYAPPGIASRIVVLQDDGSIATIRP